MIDQIADLDKKTLIKIDVEGAELRVLNGCTRLIEQHNSEFFVELSWWGDRERGSSPFPFSDLHGDTGCVLTDAYDPITY